MDKQFTKEELRQRLTPEQYSVTQEKGTERVSAVSIGIIMSAECTTANC